ncbi:hypothetical protein [Flavobacterium sp.]|uniref:hypothetical protein n=1 Tax=Flavobacterium sp. TaxID=239 RepID=UPI00248A5377|nr:hypothetical protein [Flavobacterium sp.]MDI1318023.1 hypothetical protein [Flavobacterium sp.]
MLDKDLHPYFINKSELPPAEESAVWKYRALYLYNYDQVGLWSDIVTISVVA